MTLVLVFGLITILLLELSVLSAVIHRSLGGDAQLAAGSVSVRNAAETLLLQMEKNVYDYVRLNGTTNATTNLCQNCTNAIKGVSSLSPWISNATILTVINPESGATENTNMYGIAYVSDFSKMPYYQITAKIVSKDGVKYNVSRWILSNPCASSVGSSLSTIVFGKGSPGYNASAIDASGNMFFAETGGNVYVTNNGTLTTIAALASNVTAYSMVADGSGRVFFGQAGSGTGIYWTWKNGDLNKASTGLTNPGAYGLSPATDKVYFSTVDSTSNGPLLYWDAGTDAISTVTPSGNMNESSAVLSPSGNGLYFTYAHATAGRVLFWNSGTSALSTLSHNLPNIGGQALAAISNTAVAYGSASCSGTRPFLTKDGGTLTTINYNNCSPGYQSIKSDGNGQVYFGENASSSSRFYVWSTTGLTTIISGGKYAGVFSIQVDPSDALSVFFGANSMYYHWYKGTLTTIISGLAPGVNSLSKLGYKNSVIDLSASPRRIFFGDNISPANFYTWQSGTGLSTLLAQQTLGTVIKSPPIIDSTGRVYFGSGSNLYTWKSGVLSTIITSSTDIAPYAVDPTSPDTVYAGDTTNFYRWQPTASSSCARPF